MEKILCAAIWFKGMNVSIIHGCKNIEYGLVISGYRHAHCINTYYCLTGLKLDGTEIQGFLTNKNRFVDRKEGADIAFKSRQTLHQKNKLFSEDLY